MLGQKLRWLLLSEHLLSLLEQTLLDEIRGGLGLLHGRDRRVIGVWVSHGLMGFLHLLISFNRLGGHVGSCSKWGWGRGHHVWTGQNFAAVLLEWHLIAHVVLEFD